jgi:hypothetical protein
VLRGLSARRRRPGLRPVLPSFANEKRSGAVFEIPLCAVGGASWPGGPSTSDMLRIREAHPALRMTEVGVGPRVSDQDEAYAFQDCRVHFRRG